MVIFEARTSCLLAMIIIAGALQVSGQNRGCAANECCSQYGYCGTGGTYCNNGCRSSSCYVSNHSLNSNGVSGTVSDAFFNRIDMCYIEEINGASKATNNCDKQNRQYPCKAGKGYYGRGPVQTSWNFEYGAVGQSIDFDGVNNPEIVARDRVVSFKTALWFWMNQCHDIMTSGRGFGATIREINGPIECDGVSAQVKYYRDYCNQLRVDPGSNLRCSA